MLTFQKTLPERMKLVSLIICTLILGAWATPTFAAGKPETLHLAFVTEYIRQLAATENLRASAEQELKQGSKEEVFSNGIHGSTLIQLELRSQVAMLKGMNLKAPFDELIPTIRALYTRKIALHQRLINISSAFIVGSPKPNVDYGKLAAEMPKIRAELEFVDRTLFDATPSIFATLIDEKPDSKNHVSHLIITKAERTKLIDDLTVAFGSKLDEKNQNFGVSAASVLKAFLLKDFKCADESWE